MYNFKLWWIKISLLCRYLCIGETNKKMSISSVLHHTQLLLGFKPLTLGSKNKTEKKLRIYFFSFSLCTLISLKTYDSKQDKI